MPAEVLGGVPLIKLFGIVFGPLLALFAAAFGFMWKKQDTSIRKNKEEHDILKAEVYREYATKKHVEMYVSLVIKPVVESIDRLVESNRELARELKEQRNN